MQTDSSLPSGSIYDRITNEIIKAIEDGVGEFRMPWHRTDGCGLPRNAATQSCYHGINTLALWSTSNSRGYISPYWATFKQWNELGARIKKGEKSSSIIFFKKREQETKEVSDDGESTHSGIILRNSSVFNADQVDGWQGSEIVREDRTERLEAIDTFISSLGSTIQYGGGIASYSKRLDRISMPKTDSFIDTETSTATESFYSVLLHEHIHWTGHPERLNRDLSGRFGTGSYALEELVAELGAAFMCADLGISLTPRMDHAIYIRGWLAVLRREKAAIITASSAATMACRYLTSCASKIITEKPQQLHV